jgi:2,3-bisphosphoglycerate-independent phosphoglycerate mutase
MKKVLLIILDGFGYSVERIGNATSAAEYFWYLFQKYPRTLLCAHGEAVGLPSDQVGNSEVGHVTIGTGQIIKQSLPLISDSMASGSLKDNEQIKKLLNNHKTVHVFGLFSKGGVHSHISHFFWVYNFLKKSGKTVKLHIVLDGRDVSSRAGLGDMTTAIQEGTISKEDISSVQGRLYAMDRDRRTERTERSFSAIKSGQADSSYFDPCEAIEAMYQLGFSDEDMPPAVFNGYSGIDPGDAVLITNFRQDRLRQIVELMVQQKINVYTMTNIERKLDDAISVLFPKKAVPSTIGQVLCENERSQLRIAESEKSAHVTYFFDGGQDVQYVGADRIIVPSPAVSDYTETPEMKAKELTEKVLPLIGKYDFILLNFANPDMLGHTGNELATRESVMVVDNLLKTAIIPVCKQRETAVMITADHGNAEDMKFGKKTHTCAPVPFVFVWDGPQVFSLGRHTLGDLPDLSLRDIAPTVLNWIGITKIPDEMSGASMLKMT